MIGYNGNQRFLIRVFPALFLLLSKTVVGLATSNAVRQPGNITKARPSYLFIAKAVVGVLQK